MKIPFGISFKVTGGKLEDYKFKEAANFIECADSISPESLRVDYINFLDAWMCGRIKKSTLVEVELLNLFYGDLDNRASIDYREGHWDHDKEICAGGKYFDRVAKRLKAHINKAISKEAA